MKPIGIFRHNPIEGPGYFADYLDQQNIPWQLIAIDENMPIPPNANLFSGIALMGGPMSVNDDLPWIPQVLALIQQAIHLQIPVLGHCLGGQLMAKALGAKVAPNAVKEIGWGVVQINPTAQHWFGALTHFNAFHWHGETFELPAGSVHLLSSPACQNQAFSYQDIHLALQCHIEMTQAMIADWCKSGAAEISHRNSTVQSAAQMQAEAHLAVPKLQKIANTCYAHWLEGVKKVSTY